MGMTEIISPIISSDTIIGYVMCGQFFSSDSLYKKWDNLLPVLKNRMSILKLYILYIINIPCFQQTFFPLYSTILR